MSYVSEAALIRNRFESQWSSPIPAFILENKKVSKPTDAPWVRMTIQNGDANVACVGGSTIRYRHDGSVIVEIWTPLGEGDGEARELGDLAASIFRGWESGGLRFWAPRVVPLGERNGWYRVNMIAPFQRDTDFS